MRERFLGAARQAWLLARRGATRARTRLGRPVGRPRAWEADILDDIAFNRPWNLVVKVLRAQARFRKRALQSGVTIIIVNWNTQAVTRDTLYAVQSLTPLYVDVMVVDNGSIDGSREWLRREKGIRRLPLPANAGHAIALDIATLLARTKVVVTLDSDAVPLTPGWLDKVLDPLSRDGVVLAGLRSSRDFIHPVFCALDVREFVDRRLSFQVHRDPGVDSDTAIWGVNCWDTGELMTTRLRSREVAFVEPTENPVKGLPGMTTAGVVYHHGGVTRTTEAGVHKSHDESYRQWRAAIERLLPPSALRPAIIG